jgi:hypothetical protein
LLVIQILATKSEDIYVNGFLFLREMQKIWFFSLNMMEKIDQVSFDFFIWLIFIFLE